MRKSLAIALAVFVVAGLAAAPAASAHHEKEGDCEECGGFTVWGDYCFVTHDGVETVICLLNPS